jgi:hypothetical protein
MYGAISAGLVLESTPQVGNVGRADITKMEGVECKGSFRCHQCR